MKTSHAFGRVQAGQGDLLLTDRLWKPGDTRRGILAVHGRGADCLTWISGWPGGSFSKALADTMYVVESIDAGGTYTWGNDTSMGSLDAAYIYLISTLGVGAKIGLMGWSMGGLIVLNWLKRNPLKVSGIWCWAPPTNIDYFHDGSYTAEINAAYGGAGSYVANVVGHNPSSEVANYRGLPPIHIVHAQDDVTIPIQQSRDFVSAVNDPNVVLQEVVTGGHTDLFSSVSILSFMDWMKGLSWT